MKNFPVLYFKPTIVCIDDNKLVTDALKTLLEKDFYVNSFNTSKEFIKYLAEYKSLFKQNNFFRIFRESEYNNLQESTLLELKINNISNFVNAPNINNEIALVLIDKIMPDIEKNYLFKL